jgi:ABC-2 type transport system ATP-binding protein
MSAMIELQSLTKRFGPSGSGILAVDGITFNVAAGEVLGFLGPNGAGKSTTMKMTTGFLAPTSGDARICGHSVAENPIKVKEIIGYLPEGAPAYPDMTPEGFLKFCAETRGLSGSARRAAIDAAVARVNIQGVFRQPIDTLSKGFKRRVGLAQAILHNPDVLIMDEPTDGLDPNQKQQVRNLIAEMAAGGKKAIILSTHILEEVEAVCTRAIIIAKGKLVADDTPARLMSKSRFHNAVTLSVIAPNGAMVFDEIKRIPHVREIEDRGRGDANGNPGGRVRVHCTVFPKDGRNLSQEIGQLAKQKGWEVDSLRVENGRLDDVFRDLTGYTGTVTTNTAPKEVA